MYVASALTRKFTKKYIPPEPTNLFLKFTIERTNHCEVRKFPPHWQEKYQKACTYQPFEQEQY